MLSHSPFPATRAAISAVIAAVVMLPSCGEETPRGKLVYMLEDGDAKQIVLADLDGSKAHAVTSGTAWHLYPSIDAAGTEVAYVEGPGSDLGIVVQNLANGQIEEWSEVKGQNLHPTFSGDGRFLAYSTPTGPDGRAQIAIVDLAKERALGPVSPGTSGPNRAHFVPTPKVIAADHPVYFPKLSSDGRFVVFHRSTQATTATLPCKRDIALATVATGAVEYLTEPDGCAMEPALSFDDRYVAFSKQVDKNWDVYVLDRTTKAVRRVTDDPADDLAPVFEPDGSLVFASARSGRFELYHVAAATLAAGATDAMLLVHTAGQANAYAPRVSGSTRATQETWPELPEPARSSFGAVTLNGRVYIAGGHQGHEHLYPPESFLAKVEYLDLADKTWHEVAPRLNAAHGFGLAAYGNYVYAFGGFAYAAENDPQWKSLDVVERYDTRADKWEVVAHLPKPRSSNVVAQVGTKVYLVAGWDSTPTAKGDENGTFHDTIDVFDLTTEKLSTLDAKLPNPLRRALSGAVWQDKILLVGGLGQGLAGAHAALLDNVTLFDPASERFQDLPPLPFPTFAPAAGILGDRLFVFGGFTNAESPDGDYVGHIYTMGIDATWRHTGRYLPVPAAFGQVVPLGADTLGILGGHSDQDGTNAPIRTVDVFRWDSASP
jgi:N-acetylneuraminic acid mutarotase